MKTTRVFLVTLCSTATFFSLCVLNLPAAEDTSGVSAILERAARSSQLAPALEEIVKLTKGGVSESVTLAYIQASPVAYSLDAQDILRLREQGVSPSVVTAMMQHGDELRRAAAEAGKQAQTAAAAPTSQLPAPVAVAPAPATTALTPSVPASSVSVTYIGFPDYNYYRGYYGYGGGYPGYYAYTPRYYGYGHWGPRVSHGFGYGGYHRGFYGGFGWCR